MNGVAANIPLRSFSFGLRPVGENQPVHFGQAGNQYGSDELTIEKLRELLDPSQLAAIPKADTGIRAWFADSTPDRIIMSNKRNAQFDESSRESLFEVGENAAIDVSTVETFDGEGMAVRLSVTSRPDSLELVLSRVGDKYRIASDGEWISPLLTREDMLGVGLLLFSLYLSIQSIREKRKLNRVNSKGESTQSRNPCDREPNDGNFRLSHDLACTLPVGGIVTSDGRIYMRIFCLFSIAKIEVNALECCKDHDIDMWCAENHWEAIAADEAVLACFTGHIISQVLSKLSFACGLFIGGYAQLAVKVALLYPFLALITPFAQLGHDDVLIGFGGRNKGSCLCGGDGPTSFCSDRCKDACEKAGKKAKCSKCSWQCDYDIETGKAGGYRLYNPNPKQPCCPGTEAYCLQKPDRPLNYVCPDRGKGCYDCKYVCDICYEYHPKFCPNPGVGKYVLDAINNVPCCKGTPGVAPVGPCVTNVYSDDARRPLEKWRIGG